MELHELSAVQLLAELGTGGTTSVEVVRALHARADAVEPHVGAFTAQYRERALLEAEQADAARAAGEPLGPLHGLPVTLKENLDLAGTPATLGVRPRAERLATGDAVVVDAVRRAGAIVLGKTNVPQLLLAMESHNAIFGTTHNPWRHGRVPGGSSGGEAAAIASGCSPAGIGTDIGGSIRNPAAYCGVCGLKPTWGRWSMRGVAGGQPGQEAIHAQSGPLGRTVEDLTLLMTALSSTSQHRLDPVVPPLPLPDPSAVDLSTLKVGVYEDDGIFRPSPSVRRAVREAAAALEAAGATVVPYTPPASWEMFDAYFGLLSADGFQTALGVLEGDTIMPQLKTVARTALLPALVRQALARLAGATGEPRVARLMQALGAKPVNRLWALVRARETLKATELAAWRTAGLDLLVGPPTVTPAPLVDTTHDWSVGAWHTMRFNLLDLPAGVQPISTVRDDEQVRDVLADRLDRKAATYDAGSAGLPVAAQVVGRPWEEHLVLAAMAAIQAQVRTTTGFPRTPVTPGGRG